MWYLLLTFHFLLFGELFILAFACCSLIGQILFTWIFLLAFTFSEGTKPNMQRS